MDAVEYLKEKGRMTDNCNVICCKCPLNSSNNKKDVECPEFEGEYPEQAVEIVKNWSKEHPVKTYLSVLLEKFPNTEINITNIPAICPHRIFGKSAYYVRCDSSVITCVACWNREYKEEV